MSRELALHAWGDEGAERIVCLHGVTASGGHFRHLAEDHLSGYRVLAPDLLGHGGSPWEPPWRIDDQLDALLATLGEEPATWLGHSYGGRLAFELAARRPELVERLVLLDPAVHLAAHVALFAAESARKERAYATFEEAVERRYEESQLYRTPRVLVEEELAAHMAVSEDGRWRYRYSQASVVAAFGEMAGPPPPYEAVRQETLLVLGVESYVPYDHVLDEHTAAAGDRLLVVRVPGGHTVLWDALEETGAAVAGFLAG